MSIAPTSVSALTSALVHHSAVAPRTCRRHATFIAKRLAISFSALAVAPFFLAFRGAPSATEILVFACSFAPLAAAMLAARTGRLVAAHGVAAAGSMALAFSLWLGLGSGAGCALAWIAAALLEAVLSGDRRLTIFIGAGASAAILTLVVAAFFGPTAPTAPSSVPAAFIALAIGYAAIIATGSWRLAWARAAARHSAQPHQEAPSATAQEQELWRTATGLLDDAIVVLDAGGTVLKVAIDNAARLGTHLLGRELFERVHVADRPLFLQHIADAAQGEPTTPARIRLRATEVGVELAPTHLWFELRTKKTAANEVLALLREVADRQVEDCRIAAAQRAAEEAIEAKDRFFANMSHELRTPLNAIIGFSEMLASRTLRPTDADKQREYARIINQSGQHLLSVVNATLDISKIRSGTFVLAVDPFEIAPLIDQCCEMVALKAHEGRVHIVKDAAETLEVTGDKRACRQILVNLLSNAVKFTPTGGEVRVSAQIEKDALCLSVTDTGIGMEAADLARLGDPFFQINPTIGRPFEGTGLGLSVVRGLVGLLGGTIAIASEPGRGTRVDVRLPLDGRPETQQTSSATIETIPHHSTGDLRQARLDRRMKQSA